MTIRTDRGRNAMPDIRFSCPHCQQLVEAPAEAAAEQADCPECGETVVVPATSPSSQPKKRIVIRKKSSRTRTAPQSQVSSSRATVTAKCHKCHGLVEFLEKDAGTLGTCPQCDTRLAIPTPKQSDYNEKKRSVAGGWLTIGICFIVIPMFFSSPFVLAVYKYLIYMGAGCVVIAFFHWMKSV